MSGPPSSRESPHAPPRHRGRFAALKVARLRAGCAAYLRSLLKLLPFANQVIHSRWSGEAVLVPLAMTSIPASVSENHTITRRGAMRCCYPDGFSETEIFAYGSQFASKMASLPATTS